MHCFGNILSDMLRLRLVLWKRCRSSMSVRNSITRSMVCDEGLVLPFCSMTTRRKAGSEFMRMELWVPIVIIWVERLRGSECCWLRHDARGHRAYTDCYEEYEQYQRWWNKKIFIIVLYSWVFSRQVSFCYVLFGTRFYSASQLSTRRGLFTHYRSHYINNVFVWQDGIQDKIYSHKIIMTNIICLLVENGVFRFSDRNHDLGCLATSARDWKLRMSFSRYFKWFDLLQ